RRPHRRPAHGALRGDRPGRGDGRRPQPDLGGLLGHRGVRDGLAGGARVAGVVAGGGGAAHHGGGRSPLYGGVGGQAGVRRRRAAAGRGWVCAVPRAPGERALAVVVTCRSGEVPGGVCSPAPLKGRGELRDRPQLTRRAPPCAPPTPSSGARGTARTATAPRGALSGRSAPAAADGRPGPGPPSPPG